MSAKIINSHRYKKITRNHKEKKNKEAKKVNYQYRKANLKEIKQKKQKLASTQSQFKKEIAEPTRTFASNMARKKNKKRHHFVTVGKIAGVIVAILGIGILSRIIVKKENQPAVAADATPDKKVTLVQDYDFKMGMSKLDTLEMSKSKNLLLNELYSLSHPALISINKNYEVQYQVAKSIEKMSNKEYFIELNTDSNVSIEEVISSIQMLKEAGPSSIYYDSLSKILTTVKQGSHEMTITLKEEDPYFLYHLDFPLIGSTKKGAYQLASQNETSVLLQKNQSSSTLKSITFTNYPDSDNMVDDFRENKIDMFTATSDSVVQLIGKHEYNMKRYRDGQTVFLFGNKDTKLFARKEVRQALVYSLNRDQIVKKINNTFAEVIDLPFLYSPIKYKYDTFGVENVLQSQGWRKVGGIYHKTINGDDTALELTLLVNEADVTKVTIADMIKEMAEQNGIKINITKLKDKPLQEAIDKKGYDIILADVFLNDTPDITYLEPYINVSDTIASAIQIVKESKTEDIAKNIANLQEVLSSEVACIGIMARDTSVIYQKNINGFNDIGYLKVFSHIEKIGKIQNITSDVAK